MESDKTNCPCDKCTIREYYAKSFDMHFRGEDCLFECPIYKEWKKAEK